MTKNKLNRSPKTGQFVKSINIVNGRLYGLNGAVVRAKKLCNNGLRLVSFHKKLNGFVRDEELEIIPKEQVKTYLEQA